ncbi:unnamed protein product [Calypogeia fissa]
MESLMMQTVAPLAGSTNNICSCSSAAAPRSRQPTSPQSSNIVKLHVTNRSKLRHKFMHSREPYGNGPLIAHFRIRAEQSSGSSSSSGSNVDEKVREIASDEAVEGPGNQGLNAEAKAQELQSSVNDQSTELPIPAELLLQTLKAEDEDSEVVVAEQDAVVHATSDSAAEDPKTFFHDVEEEAKDVAAQLGRSVEDEVMKIEEEAEGLEGRQELDADVVKQKEFHEGGESSTSAVGKFAATRAEAREKIMGTAKDGVEVVKWFSEVAVEAGKNAGKGLEVAKEALDKRVKSFNIAADETKEVSSQVAEAAQKKLEEIHASTSQFGEELGVNLEDKKAADSLKPEHERNPLTKLGSEAQEKFKEATAEDSPLGRLSHGIQENYKKVTSEDGPLSQLNETIAKASEAGRDFTTRVSERAAEISAKASESGAEMTDKAKETTFKLHNGDARDQLKGDYEDERGNELLKGQITNNDQETGLKIDADEPQAVPSKKEDELEIGHDE